MAKRLLSLGLTGLLCAFSYLAEAAVHRVPQQHATIQTAVDAAAAGDQIRVVGPGSFCGATITKPVRLIGLDHPRIIGCPEGPALEQQLRIGFFLDGGAEGSPASGTSITGFLFDGQGVSNADLAPLAFGVLARFAHDVEVTHNRFLGTVQAITNSAGDRWVIWNNRITDLALLDCSTFCGGGAGIVIQTAPQSQLAEASHRARFNFVATNQIRGAVPAGFDAFSLVGILVLGADQTALWNNDLAMRHAATGQARGEGIVITNHCCGGQTTIDPGARDTLLAFNDGRRSQFAIVVEGQGGTNTGGLVLFGNRGVVEIEGTSTLFVARAAAPSAARRRLFH